MLVKKSLLCICLVVFAVVIAGCTSFKINKTETSLNQGTYVNYTSSQKAPNGNNVFENQWYEFEYPANITISFNTSDDSSLDFYREEQYIGGLHFTAVDKNKLLDMDPKAQYVKIAGYNALIGNTSIGINYLGPFAYIFFNNETIKNKELLLEFLPGFENPFNTIKSTLIIRKTPE